MLLLQLPVTGTQVLYADLPSSSRIIHHYHLFLIHVLKTHLGPTFWLLLLVSWNQHHIFFLGRLFGLIYSLHVHMSMALVESTPFPPCTLTSPSLRPRASSYDQHDLPRCVSDTHISQAVSSFIQPASAPSTLRSKGLNSHNGTGDIDYRELAALWHTASSFPLQPSDDEDVCEPGVIDFRDLGHRRPFHKWMKSLRKWAIRRPGISDQVRDDLFQPPRSANNRISARPQHIKSHSGSSFGFVAAVRSASVSLAGTSVMARSRRNNTHSRHSRTDRSSRVSWSAPRISEDGIMTERPTAFDLAAVKRACQRRRVLEELISTEENYIGDIRFLTNVSCLSSILHYHCR